MLHYYHNRLEGSGADRFPYLPLGHRQSTRRGLSLAGHPGLFPGSHALPFGEGDPGAVVPLGCSEVLAHHHPGDLSGHRESFLSAPSSHYKDLPQLAFAGWIVN